jgi:hypothetical protein
MSLGKLVGELTQQQLKSLLDYNPDTGRFVWTKNSSKHGRIAGQVSNGYRIIELYGRTYTAHRLAWLYVHGVLPPILDHANGDPDDNRIANLRPATRSQNAANSRKREDNTSGYKGVSRAGNGWVAHVKCGSRKHRSRRYDSPQEAHAKYVEEATKHFGEFACDGERPAPTLRKRKLGPYHPVRLRLGNDHPTVTPLRADQKDWDLQGMSHRTKMKIGGILRREKEGKELIERAMQRVAKEQQKHEEFVQRQLTKIRKSQQESE